MKKMTLKKSTLALSLALCLVPRMACACWYPGSLPTEYHLYRVCADITGADVADSHASRLRYDNLCLWRRQVGGNMLL
ncbi:MAG: hypothetical protein II505_07810, partial [Bacteroidaceae bacterium]|nr:hypothetical protein [Bacteroidaceae bacterium]